MPYTIIQTGIDKNTCITTQIIELIYNALKADTKVCWRATIDVHLLRFVAIVKTALSIAIVKSLTRELPSMLFLSTVTTLTIKQKDDKNEVSFYTLAIMLHSLVPSLFPVYLKLQLYRSLRKVAIVQKRVFFPKKKYSSPEYFKRQRNVDYSR